MNPSTDPAIPATPSGPPQPAPAGPDGDASLYELPPEVIPNVDELVIEDGKPVDSVFTEQQQRLLVESGHCSWPGPGEGRTFKMYCNVGLFHRAKQPPLVPDVMLSLDVDPNVDLSSKENRSYLLWIIGKPPDVVIEIVSDRLGAEAGLKMRDYARIGVRYYVIFDPKDILGGGVLRVFELRGSGYAPIEPGWLPGVGIGLVLWDGVYEGQTARWLRWCDRQGQVIRTGRERADQERERADQERNRADDVARQLDQERQAKERLLARLRALGVEPEE
jgi:hypothetical protein